MNSYGYDWEKFNNDLLQTPYIATFRTKYDLYYFVGLKYFSGFTLENEMLCQVYEIKIGTLDEDLEPDFSFSGPADTCISFTFEKILESWKKTFEKSAILMNIRAIPIFIAFPYQRDGKGNLRARQFLIKGKVIFQKSDLLEVNGKNMLFFHDFPAYHDEIVHHLLA